MGAIFVEVVCGNGCVSNGCVIAREAIRETDWPPYFVLDCLPVGRGGVVAVAAERLLNGCAYGCGLAYCCGPATFGGLCFRFGKMAK